MIAKRGLAGTAPQVLERLDTFRKEHGIDEFFLLTLTPDATIRKNSYTLMLPNPYSVCAKTHTRKKIIRSKMSSKIPPLIPELCG